jgi:hypothetical protein
VCILQLSLFLHYLLISDNPGVYLLRPVFVVDRLPPHSPPLGAQILSTTTSKRLVCAPASSPIYLLALSMPLHPRTNTLLHCLRPPSYEAAFLHHHPRRPRPTSILNTTTHAFSIIASALGIPSLLPFLKAIRRSIKSWQARDWHPDCAADCYYDGLCCLAPSSQPCGLYCARYAR